MTAPALAAYIRAHGFRAFVVGADIRAEMVFTQNGTSGTVWETVPATFPAVRTWLGY